MIQRQTGVAFVVACATSLLNAQGDRFRAVARRAITDLAAPEKVDDARRTLQNLGPKLVPLLREMLHHTRIADTSPEVKMELLLVLGGMGRAAVPALPELRDIACGAHPEVGARALWTLGTIVPYLGEDERAAIRADLSGGSGSSVSVEVRRDTRASILWMQLLLGAEPAEGKLLQFLGNGTSYSVAACRWLQARFPEDATLMPVVRDAVAEQLRTAVRRERGAFAHGFPFEGPDLAATWLLLTNEPMNAVAARGLLGHWDAFHRRRAIAWMHENGAALPVIERAELVLALWSDDAPTVIAACEALAAWGPAGLVALLPLRQFEQQHVNPTIKKACGSAADAVLAACADLAAGDLAWLSAIDAATRNAAISLPETRPTTAAADLASSVLHVALWQDSEMQARVLDVVDSMGVGEETVLHVYGWLGQANAETHCVVWPWLARHGAIARAATPPLGQAAVEELCASLAFAWRAHKARPAALEALVWLSTANCNSTNLRSHLHSHNTRLVARATAELLLQAADSFAAVPKDRLLELLHLPADQALASDLDRRTFEFYLSEPVQVLAALALTSRGDALPAATEVAPLVEKFCGVGLDELPLWLDASRKDGTLAAVVGRLEAECRRELGVDPDMRWPKAGDR